MSALLFASAAALGSFYLFTALVQRWDGYGFGPRVERRSRVGVPYREWLVQAGLGDVRLSEFAAVMVALFILAFLVAFVVFGGILPALIAGGFAASFPVATYRSRRVSRRAAAQEAWPRMIEEVRLLTANVGRSIPQALFEAGERAPKEMRSAFDAAHREWLISTDFPRTLSVLKAGLADPTADAACETLLVANEVGGSDLDARLSALIEDRIQDTQGRKDARAKQAGARFARKFVLIVPIGMAFAGMSVGNGRAAYQTPFGQLMVLVAIAMVAACWIWAGSIMKLPEEDRVFSE